MGCGCRRIQTQDCLVFRLGRSERWEIFLRFLQINSHSLSRAMQIICTLAQNDLERQGHLLFTDRFLCNVKPEGKKGTWLSSVHSGQLNLAA